MGPSGSEEYTDGIKLPHLLPAVVLGPIPEGTPFGQTIDHIRMFFLDGGWEKLFGNIQRRVVMPSRAPKAGDAEPKIRAQEERCHAMCDIRGMVQAVALNHDPSRSIQVKSFGPVT